MTLLIVTLISLLHGGDLGLLSLLFFFLMFFFLIVVPVFLVALIIYKVFSRK